MAVEYSHGKFQSEVCIPIPYTLRRAEHDHFVVQTWQPCSSSTLKYCTCMPPMSVCGGGGALALLR